MTIAILSAAVALSPVKPLPLNVVAASLFKNGFAVVTREATIPGSGVWTLGDFPTAVLGTFWITASKGVKLSEVVVTSEETEIERPATSIDEVLSQNVGRRMHFTVYEKNLKVDGILRSASGSIVVIERMTGEMVTDTWIASKSAILEVSSPKGDVVWKLKENSRRRVLRFKADAPSGGSLYIVALERGLTWAPAYSIDISDPKKLRLVSKATLMNDLADFQHIEARLVTGFPNMPYINLWDPFTIQQNVDQWVSGIMNAGTPDAMRAQGGFAGQLAQNVRLMERGAFDEAFTPSPIPGQQNEDLFFYRQPNVSLKKGDRGYYVLYSAESEYQHVYEWEIADQIQDTRYVERPDVPEDVWHSLRFTNTSGRPFTTATAITIKDGEILGQDMMRYVTAGSEASVKITKALDVHAESAEEEIDRKRDALVLRGSYFDQITLKGTLSVTNRKADALKLDATKYLTGELISAEGEPKRTALAKGLRAINPRLRLQWSIDLKPGEKRTLTYTYSVLISR